METGCLTKIKVTVVAEDSVHYGSDLLGQHGISFFIEAWNNRIVRRVLFDLGQNYPALRHNMKILGISLHDIDVVVLSHSHRDHTDGLVELVGDIGKEGLPIIAHPDVFKTTFLNEPVLQYAGIRGKRTRKVLEQKGAQIFLSSEPFQIMPGLTTSGEIPYSLNGQERSLPIYMLDDGKMLPDPINEEIALIGRVEDRGLILLTGCGHPGIVEITQKARAIFPGEKVEIISGGFHLICADKREVRDIGKKLQSFDPTFLLPGHCTGFEADLVLAEIFGSRFKPLYSGTEIIVSNTEGTLISQAEENK